MYYNFRHTFVSYCLPMARSSCRRPDTLCTSGFVDYVMLPVIARLYSSTCSAEMFVETLLVKAAVDARVT